MIPPAAHGPMQDALLAASNAYHGAMRLRFAEASGGSGVWQDIKPSTLKTHVKAGESIPSILRKTGDMERSLRRGESDHVLEVTENSVIEGTEDPKARFHQDGGAGGKPPKREIYVEPDQETLEAMKSRIVAGVSAVVRDPNGTTLAATDSELEAIFGIDIVSA